MDWNQALNWIISYVLRWTGGALGFGLVLEAALSVSRGVFRPEVPVMITFLVFSLALSGGLVSLYMVWLLRRWGPSQV